MCISKKDIFEISKITKNKNKKGVKEIKEC